MGRRSLKSWLLLMIGMSGCAAPAISDPMAALPYPATNTPALRQACMATSWQTPPWPGAPGQRVVAASYRGETPPDGVDMPVVTEAGDPCASTRAATRPVRRFLHNLFYADSPRLTPMPVPAEALAAQPMPMPPPGYHLKAAPPANTVVNGEIATAEQLTNLAPAAGPAMPSAAAPQANAEILQTSFAAVSSTPARAESIIPETPLALPPVHPAEAAPRLAEAAPRSAETGTDTPPGPPVHVVCEKSIRLNCKLRDVGPSGLSAVEVWFTQDGKHWQKAEHTCPPQPPYVMDVKEDGRYGITLIARNGLGIARPGPILGEAPQVWVEVDTTKPAVQVGRARYIGSEASREVAITWTATDKNLGAKSIQLAFAEKQQGPWTVIGDVENTGMYQWKPSTKLPSSFFIRVQATDRAGNTAAAVSTEAVVLDLSRPTVEILSVEAYRRK